MSKLTRKITSKKYQVGTSTNESFSIKNYFSVQKSFFDSFEKNLKILNIAEVANFIFERMQVKVWKVFFNFFLFLTFIFLFSYRCFKKNLSNTWTSKRCCGKCEISSIIVNIIRRSSTASVPEYSTLITSTSKARNKRSTDQIYANVSAFYGEAVSSPCYFANVESSSATCWWYFKLFRFYRCAEK